MSKVELYNGNFAERKECRRINGKFYRINEHCFKMSDKWFSVENQKLVYYSEFNAYRLVESIDMLKEQRYYSLVRGLNANNELLFTASKTIPNGYIWGVTKGGRDVFFRVDEKLDNYVKENGMFIHKGADREFIEHFTYRNLRYGYDKSAGYFESIDYPKPRLSIESNFTFGLELETEEGKLSSEDIIKNGLCPLRDGSINGYEYATAPFSDIGRIEPITHALRHHAIDINGSLHVHIGNIDVSQTGLVKAYHAYYLLQNEIYKMFPNYKKHNNGIKNKNYTSPLRNLEADSIANYSSNIIDHMTNGELCQYNGELMEHPIDPTNEHKWDVGNRYKIVNFLHMVFSKSRTIEIRVHEASLNKHKIIYWVLLNEAIMKFVESVDYNEIYALGKNVTLDMIINSYAREEHKDGLLDYVKTRKDTFSKVNNEKDPLFRAWNDSDLSFVPNIKLF